MKRTLKNCLSLVLAVTIVFSSVLVGLKGIGYNGEFAVKTQAASGSDLVFALDSDGKTYSVSDCNEAASGKLVIPETYNGLAVTSISSRAFENCANLVSVYIHDAIVSIGDCAFIGCENLDTVYYESDEEAWSAIDIGIDNEILENAKINYNVSKAQTLFTVKANCIVDNKVTYTVYLNPGVNVSGTVIFAKFDNSVLSPVFDEDGCGAYMVDDGDGGMRENVSGMYETGIMAGYSDQVSIAHAYGQDVDYKNGSSNKGYMTFAFEIMGDSFSDTTVSFHCYEFTSRSDPGSNIPNGSNELIIKLSGDPEHSYTDWIIDKEASCTENGLKHKECTVCGQVLETETIPQLKCAAPKLTKVESTSSGVKVTWGKTSGADSYIVYRKTYSNGKWSSWSEIKTGATGTSYTDTNVKSGEYYRYTVRAKNESGLSGYDSTGLKIKFLSTPKLSSIANGSGKVTVRWGKVTGASSYTVYRKTYSNGKWSGWSKIGTTKNTYYDDSKVSSGKYYKYTVRATSGDYISYYNTSGLQIKYLAVASLKSAVSQKDGIKVTWGKVTGAKGYEVYRKTYSNGKWSGWTKIKTVSSGSTVSYTDKSAKKGVTYKYTVRAISDSNKGYYNTSGLQVKDKY
ncbi:MAG: leucine-rich repeat protein [Acutalibacteraceae bacterium]